uniref:Uncharacterized protein n=1 Tax=Tanacetum cinerariifolium TaxID=118510 RepID=A0A699HDS5_TANCI|nr:hypothetical protein [Tanacetum cinerariifolium]
MYADIKPGSTTSFHTSLKLSRLWMLRFFERKEQNGRWGNRSEWVRFEMIMFLEEGNGDIPQIQKNFHISYWDK